MKFVARCWFRRSFWLLLPLLLWQKVAAGGELSLTFFDIGQGDAALITSPTGKRVLIDAGPPEGTEALLKGLAAHGVDASHPIDLVLLSHPHLDHLGGLRQVLEKFPVSLFMDSGYESTSPPYVALRKQLAEHNVKLDRATLGRRIEIGDGAVLELLGPPSPWLEHTRSDVNANSVIARLDWRGRSALFPGDAEPEAERWLLNRYAENLSLLKVEVLKVPHHGGRFSSTAPFMAAVKPQWAVISVAKVNDYHHPTPEAMGRITQAGARILRTDELGTITLRSRDGHPWEFVNGDAPAQTMPAPTPKIPVAASAPVENAAGGFVGSKRSQVFHRADCPGAQQIVPANLLHWSSREEAEKSGRQPAKDCHP